MKLRNKKTGDILEGKCLNYALDDMKQYYSLAELNEEWEDAEDINATSMPLIENKEIREIIRAWSDVNDAGILKYNSDENSLDDIYRNTITFNRGLGLKDGIEYTITELCREEEE